MNSIYLPKEVLSPHSAGSDAESQESRNKFLSLFSALPESLQEVLTSDETDDAIVYLSELYGLDDLQTELMSWVIRNVIVGTTYIKGLPETLSRVLDLNMEKSRELSSDILQDIFTPHWEDIKSIQIQNFGIENFQTNVPAAPPVTARPAPAPRAEPTQPKPTPPPPIAKPAQPAQNRPTSPSHYQGEDLPETGGNIIDLRKANQ